VSAVAHQIITTLGLVVHLFKMKNKDIIKIEITNKQIGIFIGALTVLTLAGFVIAWESGNPYLMGHSANETNVMNVSGNVKTLQKLINDEDLQGPKGTAGKDGTNGINGLPGDPGPAGIGPSWGCLTRFVTVYACPTCQFQGIKGSCNAPWVTVYSFTDTGNGRRESWGCCPPKYYSP